MSSSTVQASRCDWDRDEFMTEWDKTYVSTNLRAGAKKYDDDFFTRLYHTLSTIPDLSRIAHCIIAATSIAVGRADVVGRIFDSLTTNMTPEESTQRFTQLRETLLIIYPFLGIPTVVPASYGIIGVLERKGSQYGDAPRVRKEYMDAEDVKNGKELRARVYQGVGNGKIFGLMEKHFTDLYACSTNFSWGYLVSAANRAVFTEQESHIIVASAIAALGATRQTRSHIKATIGLGNSVDSVKAVIDVVIEIVEWADRAITRPDIDALATDIQNSLQASLNK